MNRRTSVSRTGLPLRFGMSLEWDAPQWPQRGTFDWMAERKWWTHLGSNQGPAD